jgi:hypothetical protein
MTFTDIKQLPINKCTGELFEAALKQAIELEKEHAVASGPFQGFIQKHHPKAFEIRYIVFMTQK